jgi:transcriptional regulator with XRE-family HTH domain
MRHSPVRHNLARLRLFLGLVQKQMADLAGCSRDTIQSVELRRLALSEGLARRISAATGVHFRWLIENDLKADIVRSRGNPGHPFTKADFECVQANKKLGSSKVMRFMIKNYAAGFYGQIRALLSSAAKRNLAEVAVWKLAKFLDECRSEFGHDELIPHKEQFEVLAGPYLKVRQIDDGIALFREHDKELKEMQRKGVVAQLAAREKTRRKKRAGRAGKTKGR